MLLAWQQVYAGLSDVEVSAVEAIALESELLQCRSEVDRWRKPCLIRIRFSGVIRGRDPSCCAAPCQRYLQTHKRFTFSIITCDEICVG